MSSLRLHGFSPGARVSSENTKTCTLGKSADTHIKSTFQKLIKNQIKIQSYLCVTGSLNKCIFYLIGAIKYTYNTIYIHKQAQIAVQARIKFL